MTSTEAPFGSLLRRYRSAAGLTQEELAERAGISPRAISALERGDRRSPHRDTVAQLADALALSPAERERFAAAARAGPGVTTPHLTVPQRETPFVGRESEYGFLERHLEGEGSPVAMLAGEPGIGKTRLLDEIVPIAHRLGMTVLRGGCQRRRGEEPYTPLLEALEQSISALSPTVRRAALDGCAWLVRLMPELRLEVPSLEPAQERRLVFASVARFLGNVAGPGGTLLLLDDLQWAGGDALDLLTALVRSRPASPLRVVGTYRDTEVRPEDPLSVMLTDLAHARLVSRLPIGPISSEAATQLLDELLPDLPRTETERRILARSGGVPFFLISCAQGLREGSLGGPDRDVPWDVAQSVRQRVAGLAPGARDVLGAAAVIGRTVPVRVLLAVAAGDDGAVLDALDAACNARVLAAAGPDAYRFSHDVFRDVIDADLGPARRAVLHRRAAQALERRSRAGSVEAVAYHYERSGDLEQTAIWAERAGDRATAMYASGDAIEQYERAHRAVAEMGGQPETLARLDEKMGAPLNMSGQFGRAVSVLERALATYRSLNDDERVRSVSARIGKTYFESGYPLKGLQYVEPLLDDKTESPGMASLLVVLAHLLWRSLRYQDSLAAAERAAGLAKRFGNRQLLAEADARRGTALWKLGRWQEGQAVMERTADLAKSIGDLEVTSRTLSNLGELQMLRGDLAAARDALQQSLDSVERRKGPPGIVYNTTLFGRLLFIDGSWREARERLSEAIEITQTFSDAWVAVYPRLERARLDLAGGRWQELASELGGCRRLGEQNNDPQAIGLADALAAELDLAEGRPTVAHTLLTAILAQHTEDVYRDLAIIPLLAAADMVLGRADEAERRTAAAIARAEEYGDRLHLIDLLRTRGLALDGLGRHGDGLMAAERSLALAREIGTPYGEARALGALSAIQRNGGAMADADASADAATRILHRLGAHLQ